MNPALPETVPFTMKPSVGGRNVRIVDAGKNVGVTGGKETSKYTVVTDKNNNLVTAFPGKPREPRR